MVVTPVGQQRASRGLGLPRGQGWGLLRSSVRKPGARRRLAVSLMRLRSPINLAGLLGFVVLVYQFWHRHTPTLATLGVAMTAAGAILQERISSDKPEQTKRFLLQTFRKPKHFWSSFVSSLPEHLLILTMFVVYTVQGLSHIASSIVDHKGALGIAKGLALVGFAHLILWAWLKSIHELERYLSETGRVFSSNPDVVVRRVRRLGWRLIIAGSLLQLSSTLLPPASPSPSNPGVLPPPHVTRG